MPRGRTKNPENRTPQEAIAYFLRWAENYGYDDPPITALRTQSSRERVRDVIQWAEQQKFPNVAAHLQHVLHRMQ